MKKLLILMLALSLVLSLAITLTACGSEPEAEEVFDPRPTADSFPTLEVPAEPDDPAVPIDEPETPEEPEEPEEPETPDEPEPPAFIWLVEPTLDYNSGIYYCDAHDMFWGANSESDSQELDRVTGQLTGNFHDAHGGGVLPWVYDPLLDLMGKPGSSYGGTPVTMYPRSEFAVHFPDDADTIKVVYEVDSTLRNEHWEEELSQEAYDKAAVAVGAEFVTDFIYNCVRTTMRFFAPQGVRTANVIEVVAENAKSGIINRNGEVVVSFVFNDLLLICENTAFARLGEFDMWGIIAFYPSGAPKLLADDCWICMRADENRGLGAYVDAIGELGRRVDCVETFIQIALNCNRVDSVAVYRTADDLNRGGDEIFEGEIHHGMAYSLHYDDGESWMQVIFWREES
jgi:hypothetical protein